VTQIVSQKRTRRFVVGASAALELRWAGASDIGQKRAINEDSLVALPGLIAVADGLGGHSAGDVASSAAAHRLAAVAKARAKSDWVQDPAEIVRAFAEASDEILLGSAGTASGSGTTVSGFAVVARGGRAMLFVFNIGDSRVYRWRGGELTQLTVDHSYVQELVDAGQLPAELAELHPDANIITRALGFGEVPPHDSWFVEPATGDRYLVCTDGLTREVSTGRIAELLAAGDEPQPTAAALIAAANEAGGRDNITVAVVDVLAAPGPAAD